MERKNLPTIGVSEVEVQDNNEELEQEDKLGNSNSLNTSSTQHQIEDEI
jgi:hypothetical protein